jgi:hypothetical protein
MSTRPCSAAWRADSMRSLLALCPSDAHEGLGHGGHVQWMRGRHWKAAAQRSHGKEQLGRD